jgi:hypothetical protein
MYCAAVDQDVQANLAPGFEALWWALIDNNYSAVAAFAVCNHVLAEGCLAGCSIILPADEATLEAAYVGALPAVPFNSPEWDGESDRSIPAGARLVPPELDPDDDAILVPTIDVADLEIVVGDDGEVLDLDDDPTAIIAAVVIPAADLPSQARPDRTADDGPDFGYGEATDERGRCFVPPIAGGSPDDAGPTAADRHDFEQWLDQVDQPYPPDDQVEAEVMRAWYRRNPIGDLNADRTD